MGKEKTLWVGRSVFAGFLIRLFTVLAPRAAVTMTAAGAGTGFHSQMVDLTSVVSVTPGPEISDERADILDISNALPRHASRVYPTRDTSIIRGRVWHHTATSSTATWRNIAYGHVSGREWAGIAYHRGIDSEGNIAILNDLSVISNHTQGYNTRWCGLVLLGNYHTNDLSPAMKASIETLRGLMDNAGIRDELLHLETKATACPGKYAAAHLRATR